MKELMIFLLAHILVFLLILRVNSKYFKNKLSVNIIIFTSAIIFYISILITVWIISDNAQQYLDSFDLNWDESFSKIEQTSEQQIAMKAVVNDTWRALAPIFWIIYSATYYIIIQTLYCIYSFLKNKSTKK